MGGKHPQVTPFGATTKVAFCGALERSPDCPPTIPQTPNGIFGRSRSDSPTYPRSGLAPRHAEHHCAHHRQARACEAQSKHVRPNTGVGQVSSISGRSQADITLMGLQPRSRYFPTTATTQSSNEVVISSAMAYRYGLAEGESMVLTDQVSGSAFRLKVVGVVSYAPGLYAFQSIADTRSLLGHESDYFNAVVTDRQLSFGEGRLASTVSRTDVMDGVSKTVDVTEPIVGILIFLSVVIFCIVLILLIRMIVDRDTYSISLMKALGHPEPSVASLYLGNYLYVVLAAAAVGIPLGIAVLTPAWRAIIESIAMGAPFLLTGRSILTIVIITLLCYVAVYKTAGIEVLVPSGDASATLTKAVGRTR